MNFFDFDSPISSFLIRLFDLVLLNLCFVVCSLPLVTIGASVTALHSVAMSMDRGKPLGRFFRAFAANFKKATALFLIFLLIGALLGLSLYLVIAAPPAGAAAVKVVIFIGIFFLLGAASFAFPLTARYENSVLATLKNAFVFALFSMPAVVLMLAIWLFPAVFLLFSYDLFTLALYVWVFVGFALSAYLQGFVLNRIFRRVSGD